MNLNQQHHPNTSVSSFIRSDAVTRRLYAKQTLKEHRHRCKGFQSTQRLLLDGGPQAKPNMSSSTIQNTMYKMEAASLGIPPTGTVSWLSFTSSERVEPGFPLTLPSYQNPQINPSIPGFSTSEIYQ